MKDYHMGRTAENIAARWKISRAEQDEFAYQSQRKAAAAQAAGKFDEEIVPVRMASRIGEILVTRDEDYPRGFHAGETGAAADCISE